MQNNQYSSFFEFYQKVKDLNFTTYCSQKDALFSEFIKILNSLSNQDTNFNSFIPRKHNPLGKDKVTIVYFIIDLGWTDFLTLFVVKFGKKLTPTISSYEKEYSLIATLYERIEEDGKSLDSLVPLIFLLKDIDFIHRVDPLNRKLLLIDSLLLRHEKYMKDDMVFLKKLELEQSSIHMMKEKSIISNLGSALSAVEDGGKVLWSNQSEELKTILEKVSSLRKDIKTITN